MADDKISGENYTGNGENVKGKKNNPKNKGDKKRWYNVDEKHKKQWYGKHS